MSKKTKIIGGAVLGVAAVVVLTGLIRGRDKNVPRVTTAKVEKVDLVSKVTANGKIQAQRKVDMSALVMGQIVNLAVKEGDHVKKGQLLLQIDRAQLAAQAQGREASLAAMRHDLDAAKSTAAQAEFDYERAKQNFKGHILAEADYQKAKSTLETSKANLAATEQRMNSTMADLRGQPRLALEDDGDAPIEGIVTALPIKEGEVTVIGTMNNAGHAAHDDLRHGIGRGGDDGRRDVRPAGQGRTEGDRSRSTPIRTRSSGDVTEVGSSPIPKNDPDLLALVADSEAINFKVKIRIDNPPDTIRPGFSVTADIVTGRRDGATAIPIQALVVRDIEKKDKAAAAGRPETEEGVYTIKDGKLEFAKVKTGIAGELHDRGDRGPGTGPGDRDRPVQGAPPGQGGRQGHHREEKAATRRGESEAGVTTASSSASRHRR